MNTNTNNMDWYQRNQEAMLRCRVPAMTAQRVYENEWEPCYKYGDSKLQYNQCTNNHNISNLDRYNGAKQFFPEVIPANMYVDRKCFYNNYLDKRGVYSRGNRDNMRVGYFYTEHPNPNPQLYYNFHYLE
jgi:hypothetical protein